MPSRRSTLLFVVLVYLVAGCTGVEIPTTSIAPTTTAAIAGACLSPEAAAAEMESIGSMVTVKSKEARGMSLAEVLRSDERFQQFRKLAEGTLTGIPQSGSYLSWLEIWDWPASRMGDDREGVTIYVPTDSAFGSLDSKILTALAEGKLDNETRYKWLGHHYVHRLYPSSEFSVGPQRTWSSSPNGVLELTLEPLALGGCPILQTDLRTANGYIHVLGGVIIPDIVQEAVR